MLRIDCAQERRELTRPPKVLVAPPPSRIVAAGAHVQIADDHNGALGRSLGADDQGRATNDTQHRGSGEAGQQETRRHHCPAASEKLTISLSFRTMTWRFAYAACDQRTLGS